MEIVVNPLSANPTKWSDTLEQIVGKLPTNCLSVFRHSVGLTLEWLRKIEFILTLKLIPNTNGQIFSKAAIVRRLST